jgi:hypothetical protein
MNTLSGISMIAMLLLLMHQCRDEDIAKDTPDCIRQTIEVMANEDVRNPPAKVYRYQYRGSVVYFIPQYCCDFPSQLLDDECNQICSPDGGFSGKGDGKCQDFLDARSDELLVWEDARGR